MTAAVRREGASMCVFVYGQKARASVGAERHLGTTGGADRVTRTIDFREYERQARRGSNRAVCQFLL